MNIFILISSRVFCFFILSLFLNLAFLELESAAESKFFPSPVLESQKISESSQSSKTPESQISESQPFVQELGSFSGLKASVDFNACYFERDTDKVECIFLQGSDFLLWSDGKILGPYSSLEAFPAYSDPSKKNYFVVHERRTGKSKLILGGVEGPWVEGEIASRDVVFNPQKNEVAYLVRSSNGERVVLKGREGERYHGIGRMQWSPDGEHFAYLGYIDEWHYVLVIDQEKKLQHIGSSVLGSSEIFGFNSQGELVFRYTDDFRAKGEFSSFLGVGEKTYGPYKLFYPFSPFMGLPVDASGARFAFVLDDPQKGSFVWYDGKETPSYPDIDCVSWSPDGQHIAFVSRNPFGSQLVIDAEAKRTTAAQILCLPIRDLDQGKSRSRDQLLWSPDSKKVAYLVQESLNFLDRLRLEDTEGYQSEWYEKFALLQYSSKGSRDLNCDSKHRLSFSAYRGNQQISVLDEEEFYRILEEQDEFVLFVYGKERMRLKKPTKLPSNFEEASVVPRFVSILPLPKDDPRKFLACAYDQDKIRVVSAISEEIYPLFNILHFGLTPNGDYYLFGDSYPKEKKSPAIGVFVFDKKMHRVKNPYFVPYSMMHPYVLQIPPGLCSQDIPLFHEATLVHWKDGEEDFVLFSGEKKKGYPYAGSVYRFVSPDSQHFCYVGEEKKNSSSSALQFIVRDEKRGAQDYDHIFEASIECQNDRVEYVAIRENKIFKVRE